MKTRMRTISFLANKQQERRKEKKRNENKQSNAVISSDLKEGELKLGREAAVNSRAVVEKW